ncbi:asparagine synthetase B, partial [Peribacillus sp. SIMBA_075]
AVNENILFDETSLQQYMSFQFVPEPNTLDQKVHKVEPGYQFTLRPGKEIEFKTYWKVQFKPEQTQEQKLIEEVRDAIYDSV